MAMRKILVDETNRELCEHGTVGFPMTVNHDDLWASGIMSRKTTVMLLVFIK